MTKDSLLDQATFGSFDGVVSVAGVIFGLFAKGASTIVLAASGLAVASAIGMAAGQYLSDNTPDGCYGRASVMGLASAVGTMAPVIPFFFFGKLTALLVGGLVALILATAIGAVRRKGLAGYLQTYAILAAAAVATVLVSLVIPASTGG